MPLSHAECQEIRARHQPGDVIAGSISGIVRCIRDGEPWPCETTRLLNLADEVFNFTTVWRDLLPYLPDDYDCWLNCPEADAAADLYRAIGDDAAADAVLDSHAVHDTEEEQHYERGDQVRRARAYAEEGAADGQLVIGTMWHDSPQVLGAKEDQ
jgi:hypothetical protein